MRVPEQTGEVKVRKGPYTLNVGYTEANGIIEVVGVGVEQNRPALISEERISSGFSENIGERFENIEALRDAYGGLR